VALTGRLQGVRIATCSLVVGALHLTTPHFAIAQAVTSLSAAQIDDALRMVDDEKAALKFLDQYVLQTHTGLGDGPRVGWLSTPFSRVVVLARDARGAGQTLTSSDIPTDMLVPELLVITASRPAANADNAFAHVKEIAIGKRVDGKVVDVLLPLRVREATARERKLYDVDSTARVAVFDLDALAPSFDAPVPNVVVRVGFDRVAKGTSPPTACKECVVPVSGHIR
jgi:hypothetical protein